ncbi:MAG: hypothetical protein AAF721_39535 [Myxococcota bacterium]
MTTAALLLLSACGNQVAITLHDHSAAAAVLTAGVDPDTVERTRRRRAAPAAGVTIDATLWDGALVAAGIERSRTRGEDEATLSERRARWVAEYLTKRTSFTVVIELANRPAAGEDDPLASPEAWHFVLDRGESRGLAPQSVRLQAVDRFPTDGGGSHVRLGFAVVFADVAWAASSAAASKLRLRVQGDPLQAGLSRRELGPWIASHGAGLSWWVSPAG